MGKESIWKKLKIHANRLKQELFVLYFASKDRRVPWYAKVMAICVVAYAFSPVDLIPDFIPILGYLDELVLIPIGISLALKMIPKPIIDDLKIKASEVQKKEKPTNWFMGIVFIIIWVVLAIWIGQWIYKYL